MIDGRLTTPSPKRKHATSIPKRLEKRRKSVWLAWVQGRLEKPQGNTSQPVEIENTGDEKPPQLEGEANEKVMQENEEGENKEETEQSEQEEETEQ